MRVLRRLGAVFVMAMWTVTAQGDGGALLLHQDAGAFSISLFAAPQPLQLGRADFSVLVLDRSAGDVLLDAAVDLTIGGATVRLGRGQVSNRLLQAASVQFQSPGRQHLTLAIQRGRDQAQLATDITVEPDHSRAAVVWFYVLLPVAVILLFAIHQGLKLRPERKAK